MLIKYIVIHKDFLSNIKEEANIKQRFLKIILAILVINVTFIGEVVYASSSSTPGFIWNKVVIPKKEEKKDDVIQKDVAKSESKTNNTPSSDNFNDWNKEENTNVTHIFEDSINATEESISLKVINMSIIDLLNSVSEQLGKPILINSYLQGSVSMQVNNISLNQLLDMLSENLDFNWTEKNGVIVISPGTRVFSPQFIPINKTHLDEIKNALSVFNLNNGIAINANPPGLIVNAPPNTINKINELIQQIDCAPPSIKVEFMIIEINKTAEKKLGISWQDVVGSYAYNTNLTNDIFTKVIGRDVTTSIIGTALENKNIGKILAKPYIITLNNNDAYLSTGDEVPIFSKDINGSPTVEYKKVGIELYTTPIVINLEEEIIRIKAKAIVNLISGKETQNSLTAPQISSREAQTIMNIKSGETIIIGGLFKDSEITNTSGIPLLSKVPLVGNLFKVKNKSRTNTEIVIFITATLVKQGEDDGRVIFNGQEFNYREPISVNDIKLK